MSTKMKRAAVILCGCGSMDGSEIHESTMALLALCREGFTTEIFAPTAPQTTVFDHATSTEITAQTFGETRNQLTEAARIARGKIHPLSELNPTNHDCLVVPGGFGTARNLFTFAVDGLDFSLTPDYRAAIEGFHALGKPIGVMCIAPLSLPIAIPGVEITLGQSSELTQSAASKLPCTITTTPLGQALTDHQNKVVTTPCYMYATATIAQIEQSATAMVQELTKLL